MVSEYENCRNADILASQKAKVEELMKVEMVKGDLWYILSLNWWAKWEVFVDLVSKSGIVDETSEEYPGKVDNSDILCDGKLKENLLLENDITLVPKDVWKLFVDFYGCVHTETSLFERRAIQAPKSAEIEIYPPHYSFYLNSPNSNPTLLTEGTYCKFQTIRELKLLVAQHLKMAPGLTLHLLIHNEQNEFEELEDEDATIEEANLEREKVIYVQLEPKNGIRSEIYVDNSRAKSIDSVKSRPELQMVSLHGSNPPLVPGVCGLNNLGNTCFMNSALQCMSNVPALTSYFLSGKWKSELNIRNPLGSQGRIAIAYADLIKQLWSGTRAYAVPREFKIEIARIARQFSGYAQHDTHELLVFLLDGLHEDLNRIHSKPYIEVKDSDGRPDIEVANEAWQYYKSRNDSIIVDLFHGQLKSTVICPTCQRKSVTFDPFASLILPIQEVYKYLVRVYVWPWVPNKSQLLLLELTVQTIPCAQNIIEALEQERTPHPGCQYYIPNKSVDRSRYTPLIVYELTEGFPIPVLWTNDNIGQSTNLPIYISLPINDNVTGMTITISEDLLINYIISRLYAIGINGEITEFSVGEELKLEDENDSAASHSVNSFHSSSQPDTSPTASVGIVDQSKQADENSTDNLTSLLKGRLCLRDIRGHDWLAGSENGLISLPCSEAYSIILNCQGLEIRRKLNDIRSHIQQHPVTRLNQTLQLSDCFERFTDVEQLGSRDLWYCNRCKAEKPATKKFDLWKLPDVLVVQLKRFRSHLRFHDKIDTLLEFPLTGLNLTSRVLEKKPDEKFIYDLVAVSNHMGYLGGGHYTAFALNAQTNLWYFFDDSSTRECDPSKIVTSSAYVLVYVRRKVGSMLMYNANNSNDEEQEDSSSETDENGLLNGDLSLNYVSKACMQNGCTDNTNSSSNLQDQDLMDIE
nr:ubiquitin thiolesterase [Schistosoma japonicum]CAX74617.1 ubiquitin thiolesterase [Schistosoma japonicum]